MSNERGSATVLVLAMLGVLAVFAISNALVLHHLRAELRQVEHRQAAKYAR